MCGPVRGCTAAYRQTGWLLQTTANEVGPNYAPEVTEKHATYTGIHAHTQVKSCIQHRKRSTMNTHTCTVTAHVSLPHDGACGSVYKHIILHVDR